MHTLFLNTILLGGSTADKLAAAAGAGFDQIELWRQDVEQAEGLTQGVVGELRKHRLGLTDYQVLLDFDGAPDGKRETKRTEALAMLDTAVTLGAGTLLVPASTDPDCVAGRVVEDMRWLARQAAARGLRIAHEGMAWSTLHDTLPAVWDVVQAVDAPNLGLVLDAFHLFARHRTLADLDGIPLDRLFLVQLSDLAVETRPDSIIDIARHHRLLPGQGRFPLQALMARLQDYRGPIGLEVFNDALKSQNPDTVAREAMTALRQVLPAIPSGL